MSKKKEEMSLGRRDFFRKAGSGAVGAVGAAAVGLVAGSSSASEPDRKSPNAAGYRETDHVKKFYELARF